MEASDPQKLALLEHHGGLHQWLLSRDGQKAIANMVKCLGHALRGEQWFGIDNMASMCSDDVTHNLISDTCLIMFRCNVSFSPHSVVCPLYNLTRCFPKCSDLCIEHRKVVSYISQLLVECQRFSHWKVIANNSENDQHKCSIIPAS